MMNDIRASFVLHGRPVHSSFFARESIQIENSANSSLNTRTQRNTLHLNTFHSNAYIFTRFFGHRTQIHKSISHQKKIRRQKTMRSRISVIFLAYLFWQRICNYLRLKNVFCFAYTILNGWMPPSCVAILWSRIVWSEMRLPIAEQFHANARNFIVFCVIAETNWIPWKGLFIWVSHGQDHWTTSALVPINANKRANAAFKKILSLAIPLKL